jgi:prepilin-type processing-associated H-X9-DG protein
VQAAIDGDPPTGKLWKSNVSNPSSMILLTECFSDEDWPAEDQATEVGTGATGMWSARAVVGFGSSPTARFISGGRPCPDRFGDCASMLCYFRHRAANQSGTLGDARGRLNIAFADGHVELLGDQELVSNGQNTYKALWSPNDREIEAALAAQE